MWIANEGERKLTVEKRRETEENGKKIIRYREERNRPVMLGEKEQAEKRTDK